jgi:hypothetical protein
VCCAGTRKKPVAYDYNQGTVRAVFINGNFDTSSIIKKQNESIEQILKKHYRNNPNVTVLDYATSENADYEMNIYLFVFRGEPTQETQ